MPAAASGDAADATATSDSASRDAESSLSAPRVAVTALDWHPKRSVMATGGADGNVRVWVPPGESERYARA